MARDGSIVIDTAINESGFIKGTKSIKSACNNTVKTLKKFGTALASVFAVRQIIQFGKEAIQLGSDLQEVQNVVDVVFTTLNEGVNDFARSAAQTAGLSETMAKRYVGTFGAMATSFKFTESEAYEMSTALTQLSGDVASFYNITQDEAFTKLKSVFTGETETLKDLGVVMTQTALDSYALATGAGKTTKQMTEQEKVALRYKFVLDQLTNASGDFVRTSGSWANQTRILKLQLDSIKASIGQGLINALTPVIKVINVLISKLLQLANAFKSITAALFGGSKGSSAIQSAASGFNEVAQGAENIASGAKEAEKATKSLFSGLDEINTYSSADAASGGGGIDAGAFDIGPIEGGTLDLNAEINDQISPKLQAIVDKIKEVIAPLKEINFGPLEEAFGRLKDAVSPITKELFAGIEWVWYNILVSLASWTIESAVPAFLDILSAALRTLNEVVLAFQPLALALWEHFLQPIAEWTGGVIVDVLQWIAEKLNAIADWVSAHREEITNFIDGVITVLAALTVGIGGFVLAEQIATAASTVFGAAIAFLTSPIGIAIAAVTALIAIGIALYKNWDQITAWLSQLWENIKAKAQNIWASVTNVFATAKAQAVAIFESMKSAISGVFNSLKNAIKTPINGIIGFVNGLVSGIISGINAAIRALNRLKISIPSWVPVYGGKYFGFNLSTLSTPQIPYLASGAVIPPNAPFTAVLGDQKNGTNIETPEKLLRKIMREEFGNRNAQYKFTAQINRRTLFEEMIAEAKLRQGSTGKNPFELA